MFFWNSLAFSMIQHMLAIWSLLPLSAFSKTSLNIWKFTVHILLKPGLENFEHYFTSVWDESNSAVVWAFFGIAFLWDWNENGPFPVLWPISLVAQSVKSLPAVWETLGGEDPLEKEMTIHASIPVWRNSLVGYSPRGRKESDTTERLHFTR